MVAQPRPNRWIAISGPPSSGKSTLVRALADLGYHTVPEAAQGVVDKGLAAGLTIEEILQDDATFQDQVWQRHLEQHALQDPNKLTIFDHGIHSNYAYRMYAGFPLTEEADQTLHTTRYLQVFILEPLETFTQDYHRRPSETLAFAQALTPLMFKAYELYGMNPIAVPPMPVKERVAFVLKHIPAQQNAPLNPTRVQ